MTLNPTKHDHRPELAVPNHLAPYAAEVDAWRREALAYRASLTNRKQR